MPRFSRSTPSVGDATPGSTTAPADSSATGLPTTRETRPQSSMPSTPHHPSNAARPSVGTSKLFGLLRGAPHAESLSAWARHGAPCEQRAVARNRIRAAAKLDLNHWLSDGADLDLHDLDLATVPVESLLRLHRDITVHLDLDRLSPDTREALTAGVLKEGYHGPTFEPGPKTAAEQACIDTIRATPLPQQRAGISTITDANGAAALVQMLVDKGFNSAQLKELQDDIREFGNNGNVDRGNDWFLNKYGDVFDEPISEPGALRKYARLVAPLALEVGRR